MKSSAARLLRTVSLPYLPALLPPSLSLSYSFFLHFFSHQTPSPHIRPPPNSPPPPPSFGFDLSLSSRWSPLCCSRRRNNQGSIRSSMSSSCCGVTAFFALFSCYLQFV
ncbi:hypothetical protein Csa_006773 [Cucumis sativus]|uniref:Uncharacterized protein n=1 Tax=Cucumis sativus TaxID=3659 RepID=A0A0A0LL70_CUCSA|nr:hypothetical protein Csa_006773 [Cucumis sativus]